MAKPTVLIVDDEASIRKMLAELLTLEGYIFESASNGSEALALLEHGNPRVVLLDLHMDPVPGWDVMEALQQSGTRNQHKIIFVSATDRLEKYRYLNPDGELAKPFTAVQLLGLLEKHAA